MRVKFHLIKFAQVKEKSEALYFYYFAQYWFSYFLKTNRREQWNSLLLIALWLNVAKQFHGGEIEWFDGRTWSEKIIGLITN